MISFLPINLVLSIQISYLTSNQQTPPPFLFRSPTKWLCALMTVMIWTILWQALPVMISFHGLFSIFFLSFPSTKWLRALIEVKRQICCAGIALYNPYFAPYPLPLVFSITY